MQAPETPAYPLWDLPTRLFHWLLVLGFLSAWGSYELGLIEVHFYVGYSLLGLLLFRIGWGLFGSAHARFSDFLRGPGAVIRYLKDGSSPTPGHNPLGGWSVLLMLLLLLGQTISGLFNANDSGSEAPYHHLLSGSLADLTGELHESLFDVLLALVGLHLLAIAFYSLLRHQPLIAAMWRGQAPGKQGKAPPVPVWRAIVIALLSAALVVGLVLLAPEPETIAYY